MIIKTIDLKNNEVIEIIEDSELNALYIGKNQDNLKTTLRIVHNKPNLKSRINIKAVIYDLAKFDLEAILTINKGAAGTDTYLKIDCLVMSESAFARAIPSLEIMEDEVKGGHGATIGYVDPQMMHYLQTKGLSKLACEELLVEAFISF